MYYIATEYILKIYKLIFRKFHLKLVFVML